MKVLKSHWPEKYQEEKDVVTLKVDQVRCGRGSSKHGVLLLVFRWGVQRDSHIF